MWGLVIAGFLFNAALAVVQITNHSEGLYGLYAPGSGPVWVPTHNDLLESPGTAELCNLRAPSEGGGDAAVERPRAILVPRSPFLFGTMMSSPGAFLALGTLALPLTLALAVHLLSPRGSRESLSGRLGRSSLGSLVLLLVVMMLLGSFLVGLIAGPWYSIPLIMGLAAVGFPALGRPTARGVALSLTCLTLIAIGLGVLLGRSWTLILGGQPPVEPPDPALVQSLWSESLRIFHEFPLVGAGLGSFGVIHPYYKHSAMSSTTAMSSLLQWGVESGGLGLGLLGLGILWCLVRIPGAIRRVGRIDRALAHGLLGAVLSLSLLAAIHWTVELSAVAVSASALGGAWNRWLAGGTDLFVEHG